jgi:hypothetical protein
MRNRSCQISMTRLTGTAAQLTLAEIRGEVFPHRMSPKIRGAEITIAALHGGEVSFLRVTGIDPFRPSGREYGGGTVEEHAAREFQRQELADRVSMVFGSRQMRVNHPDHRFPI